jgi:deoxyadenosine/deoxycytidine kinase
MDRRPNVWVEGLIAAGKSSITGQLAESLGFRSFPEPVADKGYLELFYADPKRWAFSMQIEMLRRRWDIHRLAMLECRAGTSAGTLLDRGMPGDRVFAWMHYRAGNIHSLEWQTYEALYSEMMSVPHMQPTLLLYLDVTPETALRRIRKRARPSEEVITLDYLATLREAYQKLLHEIEMGQHAWSNGMQILRVNWSEDNQPIAPIVEQVKRLLQLSGRVQISTVYAPTLSATAA